MNMQQSETKRMPQVGETVSIRAVGPLEAVVTYVNDDGTIVVDPCYVSAKWVDELNPYWLGLTTKCEAIEDSEAPKTVLGSQIQFQCYDGDHVIAGTVVGRKGDRATVRVQEQTVSTTTMEVIPASTKTVAWDDEFETWVEVR